MDDEKKVEEEKEFTGGLFGSYPPRRKKIEEPVLVGEKNDNVNS